MNATSIVVTRLLLLILIFPFYGSCLNKKSSSVNEEKTSLPVPSATDNSIADTTLIKSHLKAITKTKSFRTHDDVIQLNQTAEYIRTDFARYSQSVSIQDFSVQGKTYKNIIASFGTANSKRIVIGAHYDVCGKQQVADDNASGVTGLLELARMLSGKELKYRIDLVAYSLEEPPHFRKESMGSFMHAKSLADEGASVYGMISLEMIGYFSDEPGSQSYPDGVPPGLFGDKGDYIALVTRTGGGPFQQKFCAAFKSTDQIKSNQYMGPTSMPGIDFSDHLNYWKFNFDALMITDTSFYRNKNYHTATDTLDTLDLKKMAKVIDGIYQTLLII